MNIEAVGSPIMLVVALVFVFVATISADRRSPAVVFFGLLSIILTVMFCAAQIIKAMKP
jgi:hypothetical protein